MTEEHICTVEAADRQEEVGWRSSRTEVTTARERMLVSVHRVGLRVNHRNSLSFFVVREDSNI